MNKIFFLAVFSFFITTALAQELKKPQADYANKQLDKAKTEIDDYVIKNPNDPQGWYLKSKIYGGIAASDQFKTLVSGDARMEAFNAFKKAMEVDKANKLLLDLNKDQYKPIIDIYTGYYDAGANLFNNAAAKNNKADFIQALEMFKNANTVGQYIYTNKLPIPIANIDTGLVLTMAKAAINADKQDDALLYFKELADANIHGTKDDKASYILPYQWLTYHYKEAKDEANLMKYSSLGNQFYPKDDYFDAILLDYYRDKKNYDALFKKYDEVIAAFPDSLQYHFNYANEVFSYIYSDAGSKSPNREVLLKNVGAELQKALVISPDNINTNWLTAQYYYNEGVDQRDQATAIKSTKPEDVKKKADLNSAAKDLFTKSLAFAEKALSTLENNGYKKSDKSKYKSIADLLQRINTGLGQQDKVKMYQAKYDAADTKFVN